MEHGDIDQLPQQERDDGAGDGPQALAEDRGERGLVIGHALRLCGGDPPAGRDQRDSDEGKDEAIDNQGHRQP